MGGNGGITNAPSPNENEKPRRPLYTSLAFAAFTVTVR